MPVPLLPNSSKPCSKYRMSIYGPCSHYAKLEQSISIKEILSVELPACSPKVSSSFLMPRTLQYFSKSLIMMHYIVIEIECGLSAL